ncbi:sugar transporter ERD6-like 16 [Impatiens glandulifera]|uniref:sugar transporter ERD6-like 16 n=1 Tax=Impatiens glandulifera TaxID=253017 RepID=UPI001FB09024|nr:sugar transporter ERD6-like 16 [Impatiens glandulifera]
MAGIVEQINDLENGFNHSQDLEKPLINDHHHQQQQPKKKVIISYTEGEEISSEDEDNNGSSIGMVLLSTAVAVCGSFEFGTCVGYSAPTQSAIRNDLHLSLAEFSMFGSILTIGAMIGAITSGHISDLIGRKGAMRLSSSFCIAGWLAVYFSMGPVFLDVGRFLTGYGIGIFSYVVPIFIAEIAPKNLRGGLATLNQLLIVLGSSVVFLLGTVLNWRQLALIGLLPCIFQFVGLFFIPESPRWLVKVGLNKEFEVSLQKLRGKDADTTREKNEIQAYIKCLESLPKARILDLFEKKYLRAVIIGVGLMVFQQFVGINGIGFYFIETLAAAGLSGKMGTISFALIQIPITMIGAVLMDKSGRKPLLIVSASGLFVGCLMAAASFFFKGQSLYLEWTPFLAVAGILIYVASFSIGMGAVPWVIMSEIFPIHIKGVAGSLVVLVNWLGAWIVSYTFNFLMTWDSTGTFLIYAAFCVLTVLFVARVVPETKGKTLEEIENSMK